MPDAVMISNTSAMPGSPRHPHLFQRIKLHLSPPHGLTAEAREDPLTHRPVLGVCQAAPGQQVGTASRAGYLQVIHRTKASVLYLRSKYGMQLCATLCMLLHRTTDMVCLPGKQNMTKHVARPLRMILRAFANGKQAACVLH